MHIILVSNRLAKARTIAITPLRLALAAFAFVLLVLALSGLFSYITVRHAAEIRLPFLQDLVRAISLEDAERSKVFVRENLKAMAVRLGEMQARLTRLDSLGERIADLSGIKTQEITAATSAQDGRGGPLIKAAPATPAQLEEAVEALSRRMEVHGDTLSMLESQLFEERVRRNMLPTSLPIDTPWNASGFGWRIDPFTGERALHEGVDFPADIGRSIRASAAGVVIMAERHPEYGNMIEIDHGNEMSTRYAHVSRLLVSPGTIVRRGQVIAEVGNTGRSTGPHLHFEVRYKGTAQNPERFLRQARDSAAPRLARR